MLSFDPTGSPLRCSSAYERPSLHVSAQKSAKASAVTQHESIEESAAIGKPWRGCLLDRAYLGWNPIRFQRPLRRQTWFRLKRNPPGMIGPCLPFCSLTLSVKDIAADGAARLWRAARPA